MLNAMLESSWGFRSTYVTKPAAKIAPAWIAARRPKSPRCWLKEQAPDSAFPSVLFES
jgi:hypothetical protein